MKAIAGAILALAGAAMPAAAQDLTVHPVGSEIDLPAQLIKPEGDGPFPAMVIVYDCSGLGPKSSGSPRARSFQVETT